VTTRETITSIGASVFVLSLRGAQRRGNPAEPLGNFRIARASRKTIPTGLPHPNGFAMTRVCGLPCPHSTGDNLHPNHVIIFPCKRAIST